MRPKLLRSMMMVTLFWFVATTLYWSFSDPRTNWEALRSLHALFPFLPLTIPDSPTIMTSLGVQLQVLAYWTVPMLAGTAISALVGTGLVWYRAWNAAKARAAREGGSGEYRGLTVTLGNLPVAPSFPCDEIELGEDPDGLLRKATAAEKRLLEQIFGTLSAHPDCYPGPANTGTALDVAMATALRALEQHRTHPGLAACAAAAHELGKITAFKKNPQTGAWVASKDEEREAARILSTLSGWWALPSDERTALCMAVKYKSQPRLMPEIEGSQAIYRLSQDLLYTAKEVQTEVVQEEKQKTLEKHELPDVVFEALKKALPLMAFQNKGLPKGVRAVAWKTGRRVYMLEIALRESVTAQMSKDIVEALQPTGKNKPRVQPFTVELLKALDSKGWLVTEIGERKLPPAEALWTVQAGKLEFRGVIVIDVPDEFLPSLPAQDSMYELAVTGVLFTHALKEDKPAPSEKTDKAALSGVLDFD